MGDYSERQRLAVVTVLLGAVIFALGFVIVSMPPVVNGVVHGEPISVDWGESAGTGLFLVAAFYLLAVGDYTVRTVATRFSNGGGSE